MTLVSGKMDIVLLNQLSKEYGPGSNTRKKYLPQLDASGTQSTGNSKERERERESEDRGPPIG